MFSQVKKLIWNRRAAIMVYVNHLVSCQIITVRLDSTCMNKKKTCFFFLSKISFRNNSKDQYKCSDLFFCLISTFVYSIDEQWHAGKNEKTQSTAELFFISCQCNIFCWLESLEGW